MKTASILAFAGVLSAAGVAHAERIAIVGDSIAVGLTAPIAQAVARTGAIIDGYGVSGSGLANPRLADWQAKAKEIAATMPDAVIIQIGTNDGQGMGKGLPFGTDAWKEEYRSRLDAFLAPFVEVGTEIRCLETLPADRPDLKGKVPLISGIVRDACLAAGASFVPVGEVPPKDRAGDRVHLTVSGYDRLGWLAARAVHTGTP